MTTSAEFEPELVEALNLLIQDERASVEMEVALASGATEYAERDTLSRMGVEDIATCETLRAEMETAGLSVTMQINGVVFEVLGAEHYDDRLRAFAHHQRIVSERAGELLESNLDGALREALETIIISHERHGAWATNRADEFAATRLLEFGPRQDLVTPSTPPDTAAAPAAAPVEAPPIERAAEDLGAPADQVADYANEEATVVVNDAGLAETLDEATRPAAPVRRARATTPRKPIAATKPTTKKPSATPRAHASDAPAAKKPSTRRKPAAE